ncbi:MAG: hypothetical protein ACOC90_02895 [Bacteroidota bacterium]
MHELINNNPDLDYATGYTYYGLSDWTPSDACCNDTPLAQSDIEPEEDLNSLDQEARYKEWGVTGMVQE